MAGQRRNQERNEESVLDSWKPKTELGKKVKSGEISDIKEVLESGKPILEDQIVTALIPDLQNDLLLIGQAKGKFGGGKRRAFRQTQKKTKEGNKLSFATLAVVGNGDGYVGVGFGKSQETIPAREKALRSAKLNLMKIKRGSGSWEGSRDEPNSIPFAVTGRCGSTQITLMPAPKGTGLVVEKECQKILNLAGVKDVWSKTRGQTKIKINLIKACVNALEQLSKTRVQARHMEELKIVEGPIGSGAEQ